VAKPTMPVSTLPQFGAADGQQYGNDYSVHFSPYGNIVGLFRKNKI